MTRLQDGILPTFHMTDLAKNYCGFIHVCLLLVNSQSVYILKEYLFFSTCQNPNRLFNYKIYFSL